MPFKILLPKGSILEIESPVGTWNKVTEHNREPLEMSNERIEQVTRMANGTLRKYYVADKKKFSTRWEFVPGSQTHLVDSGTWGVDSLRTFFGTDTGRSSFNIRIRKADNTYEGPYTVIFSNFELSIVKRGIDTFYNLDVEMTEV